MKNRLLVISVILSIITISGIGMFAIASAQEESKIPVWIRTAIGFWINHEISDEEFLKAIEYFVENEIIQVSSSTSTNNEEFIDNLKIFQTETNSRIESLQNLVALPQIQEELKESNAFFTRTGNPQSIMQQIDEQWQSSDPDVVDSVAYNLIHNSSGDILRTMMNLEQIQESQFQTAEIFITNQYGANVAQSHKTSDYKQDDEKWWQEAKEHGIHLSEGGFDESSGVYSSDIALRIQDSEGNFIGILKAVVNIESLISEN